MTSSDEPSGESERAARLAVTDRTRLKRRAMRAQYDRATVHAILDEGLVAHVAIVHGGGPVVVPTAYGRDGDELLLHGAVGNRVFAAMASGADACVEVTLLDALVLARSAFHHSVNYRCVVLYGKARVIEETAAKRAALERIVEHVVPGRWREVREPTDEELAGTLVLALPIAEGSAKVRTGPPVDDDADYALPTWAGIIPLSTIAGEPVDDGRLTGEIEVPAYASVYRRPGQSTDA